jgi:hypothetical protein
VAAFKSESWPDSNRNGGRFQIGTGGRLPSESALFGVARVRAELHLAQRLLDWLLQDWLEPVISLIEIYQQGPNPIREKATAQKLVDILVEHGWLEKIPEGAVVAGQRRRDAWRIVRG